jgi:hypothetical protein
LKNSLIAFGTITTATLLCACFFSPKPLGQGKIKSDIEIRQDAFLASLGPTYVGSVLLFAPAGPMPYSFILHDVLLTEFFNEHLDGKGKLTSPIILTKD